MIVSQYHRTKIKLHINIKKVLPAARYLSCSRFTLKVIFTNDKFVSLTENNVDTLAWPSQSSDLRKLNIRVMTMRLLECSKKQLFLFDTSFTMFYYYVSYPIRKKTSWLNKNNFGRF